MCSKSTTKKPVPKHSNAYKLMSGLRTDEPAIISLITLKRTASSLILLGRESMEKVSHASKNLISEEDFKQKW